MRAGRGTRTCSLCTGFPLVARAAFGGLWPSRPRGTPPPGRCAATTPPSGCCALSSRSSAAPSPTRTAPSTSTPPGSSGSSRPAGCTARRRPRSHLPDGWRVVTDPGGLARCNERHDHAGVLLPAFLGHPRFTVLAQHGTNGGVGGAVLHEAARRWTRPTPGPPEAGTRTSPPWSSARLSSTLADRWSATHTATSWADGSRPASRPPERPWCGCAEFARSCGRTASGACPEWVEGTGSWPQTFRHGHHGTGGAHALADARRLRTRPAHPQIGRW